MIQYLADPDVTLYHGDALDVLRELPDESIDCCVTSPPYWGLRDYGTDGQLGLERTPAEYVDALVGVFAEVRRVLRPAGTLWLNLGDSYAGGKGASGQGSSEYQAARTDVSLNKGHHQIAGPGQTRALDDRSVLRDAGLKPKDLVGIPWRVAFALQADGWWLRSDIVWSKPNPMPESVRDRPTKSHEYVFLLAKSESYYFGQEDLRERYADVGREWWNETATAPGNPNRNDGGGLMSRPARGPDGRRKTGVLAGDNSIQHRNGERWPNLEGRNVRSVWQIATEPYSGAHFAVFPQELARRCILGGCPERVCRECGKARERIVDRGENIHPGDSGRNDMQGTVQRGKRADGKAVGTVMRERHEARQGARTIGFTDCGHNAYAPGVVLDPFAGSGTTLHVARTLQRHAVGIELSADYCRLAAERLQQLSLLAEGAA